MERWSGWLVLEDLGREGVGNWVYLEYPSGDNELEIHLLGQAFEMDPESYDGENDEEDMHV